MKEQRIYLHYLNCVWLCLSSNWATKTFGKSFPKSKLNERQQLQNECVQGRGEEEEDRGCVCQHSAERGGKLLLFV